MREDLRHVSKFPHGATEFAPAPIGVCCRPEANELRDHTDAPRLSFGPFPPALFAQALSQMTFAAALLVAVVYGGGVCNDKKTDCANWARDGECAGDNAVRARLCAVTARVSVQQLHLLIF